MVQYVFTNAPATPVTLAGGGINSSVTTIVVAAGRGADLPAPGADEAAILRIEDEYVTYTTRSTDTLTGVTRGFSGSTAASHAAGVEIRNVATKEVFDAIGTTYTSAYASPPVSPTNGDWWLPSDSLGLIYARVSGAWVARAFGKQVTEPPAAAGWTHVNWSGTTSLTDRGGLAFKETTTASDPTWRLAVKAAPATPYIITMMFLFSGNVNCQVGPVFRQSSDGKFEISRFLPQGQTSNILVFSQYTSPTSLNANQNSPQPNLTNFLGSPCWMAQIEDNGTNRYHRWSADLGETWVELRNDPRTSWITADQVGFGIQLTVGTSAQLSVLGWTQT